MDLKGRSGWLAGLAAGGILVSHWAAYRVALPSGAARAETLAATGHAYWTWAVLIALAGLMAGFGAFVIQRWKGSAASSLTRVFGDSFLRLVAYQAIGFVVLESLEWTLSGHSLATLIEQPAIAVGLAIQAGVALVAALVLMLLAGAVDRVARLLDKPVKPRPSTGRWVLTPPRSPRPTVLVGGRTLRGPPLTVR